MNTVTNEQRSMLLHVQQNLIMKLQAVSLLLGDDVPSPKQAVMEAARKLHTPPARAARPADQVAVPALLGGTDPAVRPQLSLALTPPAKKKKRAWSSSPASKARAAKYKAEADEIYEKMLNALMAGPAEGMTAVAMLDACNIQGKYRRQSHAAKFQSRCTVGWTDNKGIHHPPQVVQLPQVRIPGVRSLRTYKLK